MSKLNDLFNALSGNYAFDEATINDVWRKGRIDVSIDPTGQAFRRDAYGTVMKWENNAHKADH